MRNVAIFRQTDFVFFDKPATAIFNSKMFFSQNVVQWFTLIFMQPCLLDDFQMVAIEYTWKS